MPKGRVRFATHPLMEEGYRRGYLHANLYTAEDFYARIAERVRRGEPLTLDLVGDVCDEFVRFNHTDLQEWACKDNLNEAEEPPDFLCWAARMDEQRRRRRQ
ncbi:MAG TPA: hypothetical protein VIK99_08195 [Thermaerobacter sp.]